MTLNDLTQGQHFKDEEGRDCVFLGISPDGKWGAYYYNSNGTWVATDDTLDMEIPE